MLDEAPGYRAMFAKTVLTVVLVLGFVAVAWCWTQRFGACEIGNFSENVRLGLNLTAETVKLLLTLSTALAALGGAVVRPGLHWSIPDPVRVDDPAAFDTVVDELTDRITRLTPAVHAVPEPKDQERSS